MQIKTIAKNNYTYHLLIGKVCTLADFKDLRNILSPESIKSDETIVLDLSRITFISSQGLGTLVALYNSLQGTDVLFFLFNPRGEIKEELNTSGISMIIPTVYTEQELEEMIKKKRKK